MKNKRVAPQPEFADLSDAEVRGVDIKNLNLQMLAIHGEVTRLMQAYLDDPDALAARGTTAVENFALKLYDRWQENKKMFGDNVRNADARSD